VKPLWQRQVYNWLIVPVTRVATPVVTRAVPKVGRGIAARQGVLARWQRAAEAAAGQSPVIWLHAASAGETLQARPLATAIRRARPEAALFFTHFSPSAEQLVQSWDVPDAVDYLPLDYPAQTRELVGLLAPDALVLVGGETWPNLVWAASDADVLLGQVCCRLVGSARVKWPVRSLTRDLYRRFDAVAAIGAADAERLADLGVDAKRVRVAGDTRADVTLERVRGVPTDEVEWQPSEGVGPVIVGGSTWPADERVVLAALARLRTTHPNAIAIVAPHEPTEKAIARLQSRARGFGFSTCRFGSGAGAADCAVVIVDRVGLLYRLYAVADLAYVGGGFGGAVHNVMEPAAHGVPVTIGADHGHPHEVDVLERAGGLAVVDSPAELAARWRAWLPGDAAGGAAKTALEQMAGATERTLTFLREAGFPV
jgi:3-deoxy-D-manno-octulosonic-acid transferase